MKPRRVTMGLSIIAISSPLELTKFSHKWDGLVRRFSTNPFCLAGFVMEMMEPRQKRGWSPLLVCLTRDGGTIGVAPLMMKTRFGVRYARFLLDPELSPDFILEDACRELCMRHITAYLFETLHCSVVDLTMPAESRNVEVLKTVCEGSGVQWSKRVVTGHTIIQVKGEWGEFAAARGRNFRKYFRLLERRLNRSGSWRTLCLPCDGRDSDMIRRIDSVEEMSWKESQRKRMGETDETLPLMLRRLERAVSRESDVKSWACFLELGGQTLAYILVLEYKRHAFLLKTSFDERFREYYPGTYVLNTSIHHLFDEKQVTTIDFTTDLPFHRRWSSTCLGRVRVTMCREHLLHIAVRFLTGYPQNMIFAMIRERIETRLPFLLYHWRD